MGKIASLHITRNGLTEARVVIVYGDEVQILKVDLHIRVPEGGIHPHLVGFHVEGPKASSNGELSTQVEPPRGVIPLTLYVFRRDRLIHMIMVRAKEVEEGEERGKLYLDLEAREAA